MIEHLKNSASGNFFLLAGPCVIEGEQMAMDIAGQIVEITRRLGIPYVFKGSYRKANRSRIDSFTGIGDIKALEVLKKVGQTYNIPVVTDIHAAEEAAKAGEYVDVLQIPAFLCRQTDLLVAAARTGKTVNIKKGQFLSPEAMEFAVQKVKDAGNNDVAITERGTTFGYQDLIVDYRGIPTMRRFAPVILDVTHSLQQPNQTCGVTGGPHRDNGAMRNRCRCRRSVYGDASEPGGGEVGRGKHAAARPHGGTARTAVGAAHGCKRNKPLMGRILAIDYGRKRTGIAVTDTLQIVANGLTTVPTHQLLTFLKQYVAKEPVERIVVGLPKQMNNEPSESMRYIKPFLAQLAKEMPQMPVEMYDERITSVIAHRAMLDGGMKKTARRDKAIVDEISATIILNDFLESRR